MSDSRPPEIIWKTRMGDVLVRGRCTPEEIRNYAFDREFGTHAHFRSLYTKRESLERDAEDEDANVVVALTEENHIVGFSVLAYPDPEERWARVGDKVMMELKAIEVARSWRNNGVAKGLVRVMMDFPAAEEKIIRCMLALAMPVVSSPSVDWKRFTAVATWEP